MVKEDAERGAVMEVTGYAAWTHDRGDAVDAGVSADAHVNIVFGGEIVIETSGALEGLRTRKGFIALSRLVLFALFVCFVCR